MNGEAVVVKPKANANFEIFSFFSSAKIVLCMHLVFWSAIWLLVPWRLMPTPWDVVESFVKLWNEGFAVDLWASFWLNVESLAISSSLSLGIVYLSVSPWTGKHIKPYLTLISKFRFMGLVGWSLIFTQILGGGHYLKVALLVFAMTAFMVTAMASVVGNIPKEQFDHARTLRMSQWRIIYEVVFWGTMSEMADVIIQNAAIGWTMLTMVEGLSRSEGGIGVMLLNQNKFFRLDEIFAIQLSILFLALTQDMFLRWAHTIIFPYAHLGKENR